MAVFITSTAYASSYQSAINARDYEVVKEIIEGGSDYNEEFILEEKDVKVSALSYALVKGEFDIALLLLEKGASTQCVLENLDKSERFTCLTLVIIMYNNDATMDHRAEDVIFRLIVEMVSKGADVNAISTEFGENKYPLDYVSTPPPAI